MRSPTLTRRTMLRTGWRALATGALARWSSGAARVEDRSLVCIYLFGGNDSNNLIVPLDERGYAAYASARGALALPKEVILPIGAEPGGASYGLHPALAGLRQLYDSKVLSIVANVGSLLEPVSKPAYLERAVSLPSDLLLHQDSSLGYLPGGFAIPGWAVGMPTWFTFDSGLSVVSPDPGGYAGKEHPRIRRLMAQSNPLETRFPATGLGRQLEQAAHLLGARTRTGLNRLIFLCSCGGFDTHTNQLSRQEALFRQLSDAMSAFYAATVELGVSRKVTTFTRTEFNRSMRPNLAGGTEHGWGGHDLVMGGAVLGGAVYGRIPMPALNGPDDAANRGIWIPTTSRDQYEATLAHWWGFRLSDVPSLFPRLGAFRKATLEFLT